MKQDGCLHKIAALVLALATTFLCFYLLYLHLKRPQPITIRTKCVYCNFAVIGIGDKGPVECLHEISQAVERNEAKQPIVWARTGRASSNLRYYLTPSNVALANSQLDQEFDYDSRDVEVTVIKDDPVNKTQTLQVLICSDDTEVTSIYDVQDERVRPVSFNYFRGRMMGFALIGFPLVLMISFFVWKVLLVFIIRMAAKGENARSCRA